MKIRECSVFVGLFFGAIVDHQENSKKQPVPQNPLNPLLDLVALLVFLTFLAISWPSQNPKRDQMFEMDSSQDNALTKAAKTAKTASSLSTQDPWDRVMDLLGPLISPHKTSSGSSLPLFIQETKNVGLFPKSNQTIDFSGTRSSVAAFCCL
jgi:hypothetical protein